MPAGPDAFKNFRTAAWTTEQHLASFVAEVDPLDPADLVRWLQFLIDGDTAGDAARHHNRLRVFAHLAASVPDPSLFAPYAKALRSPDPALRAVLVSLLPRVNRVQSHPVLCEQLGHDDPGVRQAAAQVLSQVGGKAAFEALYDLVGRPSFQGRAEALDVMLRKAPQHALPLVGRVLETGQSADRLFALRLLADTPLPANDAAEAVRLGMTALEDGDEVVVGGALSTIRTHGNEQLFFDLIERLLASPVVGQARAAIRALGPLGTPRARQLLVDLIETAPTALRVAAIDAIEEFVDGPIEALLVAGLSQDQVVVRTKAIEAVSRQHAAGRIDPAAVVLPLLGARDVTLRRMAIEVLHRVGDPRGDLGPRLLKHLRDEDWWVRERAMDALIELAGANLSRYLLPYLTDRSPIVRRFAIGALRRIGDGAALPHLLQRAKVDDDWWVREDAVAAAAELGDPRAIPALVALLQERPDLRLVCCRALVTLQASSAQQDIAALLDDEDADVRLAALNALRELGARGHVAQIETCAEDTDARVRATARDLVTRWAAPEEPSTLRRFVGLDDLLPLVIETDADDLLLLSERPPYLKRRGQVEPLTSWGPLSEKNLHAMIRPHLSEVQQQLLEDGKDVDFSYDMASAGTRFRVNLFRQSTGIGAVFRIIKNDALLMVLDNLGLPPVVQQLCALRDGIVLIGGPTGSGKSTTLAAMVEWINHRSARHIVTIEDPIEAVHVSDKALVTQREVRSHTHSFDTALRAALREDPDVIVVGEMRDPPTFQFAMSAAETGHLVLATVHAGSAEACVARIIGAFPPNQQPLCRAMLSASVRAIMCQALLRRRSGGGRILSSEVMINNEAIASLIRKGKAFQIPSVIVTSASQGMQLLDMELARLVREQVVDYDEAWRRANDKATFEGLVSGALQPEAIAAGPGRISSVPPRATPLPPEPGGPARPSQTPAPPSRRGRGT